MGTNTNPVEIKGQKEGLWIFLDEQSSIEELFTALEQKLSSSNNFFAGAEVTINTGTRTLSPDDVEQLHEIVEGKHSLHIREIERYALHDTKEPIESERNFISSDEQDDGQNRSATDDDSFEKADPDDDFMKALDETFRIPIRQKRYQQETDSLEYLYENDEKTFYFRGTVRSGQTLEFPGNIVIVGDVNPGAYVVASGDIIVMGRLNGVVHAGAEGEEQAVVIGASFFPSQLRIAQYIGRPPDEYPQSTLDRSQTERASIKDGTIVIEPVL